MKKAMKKKNYFGKLAIVLSAMVVFVTTYMLILPAFTLDREEALGQGGIDLVEQGEVMETSSEDVSADDETEETLLDDSESQSGEASLNNSGESVAGAGETSAESEPGSDDPEEATETEANIETDVATAGNNDIETSTRDEASVQSEDSTLTSGNDEVIESLIPSFNTRKSKGWTGFKAPRLTATSTDSPEATKTLVPNGDGTYTLTLTVKAPGSQQQSSNKANIVVVYDSSNSMHYPVEGNEWVRDDQHGTYCIVDGKYYQLNSFGTNIRKVFSYIDENGVTHSFGIDQPNSGIYCGPKYSPTKTRMDVAKSCVKALAQKLLNNNTSSSPDTVELAFVEYASDTKQVTGKTTDLSTFYGWVDNCTSAVEATQNAGDVMGGTNWDKGLKKADEIDFGDNDPTYIVFISDGNPTARTTPDGLIEGTGTPEDDWTEYDDGKRIGSGGLFGGVIPDVFGTGISDTKGYNYAAALRRAEAINQHGKTLYNIGIFGDADKMVGLVPNSGYFDGTDEQSILAAFDDIVGSISSQIGYTDVQVTDGLTSMTSTAIVGQGRATDFTYRLNGEVVTDQPWMTATLDEPVNDPDNGQYESGRIHWNLGEDYILDPNAEYSVSFIVWPDQHSYDLVADLNNGKVKLSDLTPEEASQFEEKNGVYTLKTNTVANATFKNTETGKTTEIPLDPPDPMPLDDSKVTVQKVWSDSLSPDEYDEIMNDREFHVKLNLMQKGKQSDVDYLGKPVEISKPEDHSSRIWPENDSDGHHISTGLMVSQERAEQSGLLPSISHDEYPTTSYNGKTYYILDEGYDYYFEEHVDSHTDYHFELEKKTFHPMVVDGDEMDVTFGVDEQGNSIVTDAVNLTKLTATNSLKGGINLSKVLVDADGNPITDANTKFKIHGSFNPGVRLEYRKIGPEYTDETGASGRSEKYYIESSESGDFDIELYGGDIIRFVNVPSGHNYSFHEILPDGSKYILQTAEGEINVKDGEGNTETTDMTVTGEGNNQTVSSTTTTNAEQNVTFTNCKQIGSIKLTKKVTLDGSPTNTTKADGDYYFTILDSDNKPAEGKIDGHSIENGEVKITVSGGQATTVTITDVPVGTYHITERLPNNGSHLNEIEPADAPNIDLETCTSGDVVVESNKTSQVSFTNDKSSAEIEEYTNQTVTKEWYNKSGEKLEGSDIADKTIKYKITQKRAIVSGPDAIYPVVVKLLDYSGNEIKTETYYVRKGALPQIAVNKNDNGNYPATATQTMHGYYTKRVTKSPDSNNNYSLYHFDGFTGIEAESLIVIKPSRSSLDLTDFSLTSAYIADSPEQYIKELDKTNLDYQDYASAELELSAKSETKFFELNEIAYSAEDSNWTAMINKLPLYKREGDHFYVYKYEITEIEVDGEPVGSNQYEVAYDTSTTGTTVIKNTVKEDAPTLPSTGGPGTTLLYMLGALLIAGSGIGLIRRRVRSN